MFSRWFLKHYKGSLNASLFLFNSMKARLKGYLFLILTWIIQIGFNWYLNPYINENEFLGVITPYVCIIFLLVSFNYSFKCLLKADEDELINRYLYIGTVFFILINYLIGLGLL